MKSKIKKSRLSAVILTTGLLASSPLLAAQAPDSVLANPCAGCHGTNGLSDTPMPRIAGMNEKYLAQTMKNYKSDARSSTIMGRIAKGYTDEELDGIARFFAQQEWQSLTQEVDEKAAEQGATIHAEKCETCHSEKGEMMNDMLPRLTGQWLRYLEIVMEAYVDPERKMPDTAMTKMMMQQMKDLKSEDIKALAHFYASQK